MAHGGPLLFQPGVWRHLEGGESGEEVLHAALIAILVQQQGQQQEEEDQGGWKVLVLTRAGKDREERADTPMRPPTMPGMELEPPLPLPLPSLFLPPSPAPLPYEAPSPPARPPQLVDETPLPVKAPEVVAATGLGVGLDAFCVVLGRRAPSVPVVPSVTAAPAVGWGSALLPWAAAGEPEPEPEPPLALVGVGVLPPMLATLVGVAPLAAGVVLAPPPLPDPEPESAAVAAGGVVAGLAASETAGAELVLLLPLPLPLPFASPFALPLLPLPFPFPFDPLLPLPLFALRSTVLESVAGASSALGTRASTSSSTLPRALSPSGLTGGRRIPTTRRHELENDGGQ